MKWKMSKLELEDFSLDHPRLNGLMGLSENSKRNITKSKRYSLKLFPSNEKEFPEFDYYHLCEQEVKKSSNLGDNKDDDEQLKALAKKFEEKYEYTDLGLGYDESDTFIDDSEAYDEVVPSDWTTEHGGFYINQGTLDFKPLAPEDDKKVKKKIKKNMKALKTPKELSTQKKKKQLLTKEKQRKRQESLIKAQKVLVKKKKKLVVVIPDKDKVKNTTSKEANKSFEDDVPLAKIAASKTPTQQDGSKNLDDLPLAKFGAQLNALKEQINKPKKPSNAIVIDPPPLPENLSDDILGIIDNLKTLGDTCKEDSTVGKSKFFNAEVNAVLLEFAKRCRLFAPKTRNAVYEHVLVYLPCAKDTLVKRCRALVVQNQRKLVDEPMKKLQEAITKSMVDHVKQYDDEVAKALQEQAREQIKQTGIDPTKTEEKPSGDNEEKNKKAIPKRKFIWSMELRKLLLEVVKVRVELFKMSKSRYMTGEEYIKDFLENEIRKMWPKGWMTSRILFKESRTAHAEITQQPKPKKKKVLPSLSSTASNSQPNVMVINTTSKTMQSSSVTPKQLSVSLNGSVTPSSGTNQISSTKSPQLFKTPKSSPHQPLTTSNQPSAISQQISKTPTLLDIKNSQISSSIAQKQQQQQKKQQPKQPVNQLLQQKQPVQKITKVTIGTSSTVSVLTSSNKIMMKAQKHVASPTVILQSFLNAQQKSQKPIVAIDKQGEKIILQHVAESKEKHLSENATSVISPPKLSQKSQNQRDNNIASPNSAKNSFQSPVLKTNFSPTTIATTVSLLSFTTATKIAFTTITKPKTSNITNYQSDLSCIKPTFVTKPQVHVIPPPSKQRTEIFSNVLKGDTTKQNKLNNSTQQTQQQQHQQKQHSKPATPVSTPQKNQIVNKTPQNVNQKQHFSQSPKVSPFAVTPTFVRSTNQEARTLHHSEQSVKRKSIENDVYPAKRQVLNYRSPLNTAISEGRSWSDMENDLVKLSHEASNVRSSHSNEIVRKSITSPVANSNTSPSKNWSSVHHPTAIHKESHQHHPHHRLSHAQYGSNSSDSDTSPLKHLPYTQNIHKSSPAVHHPSVNQNTSRTQNQSPQHAHPHHHLTQHAQQQRSQQVQQLSQHSKQNGQNQQQRHIFQTSPKLHHNDSTSFNKRRQEILQQASLPTHPSLKLINDTQQQPQQQRSYIQSTNKQSALDQASLLYQQQQQQQRENDFMKEFTNISSSSQQHYN